MANDKINKLVNELHEELNNTENLTEETKAELKEATQRIDQILGETPTTPDDELELHKVFQKKIEEFEGEHPVLTGMVNRIMDALSDLGI